MSRFAEVTGSWRVALRIARRSTQRHRARSALVLLMLFVPAYAATVVGWANLSGHLSAGDNLHVGSLRPDS
jgi:hypothetical protein